MSEDEDADDDFGRESQYGECPQCKKANHRMAWCNPCDRKALVEKFNIWSTGNEYFDRFIQKTQRTAESYYKYLEYVPYEQFDEVEPLARGGFGQVLTATWVDGFRQPVKKDDGTWVKGRSGSHKVALKTVNNSKELDQGFINELELHFQFYQQAGNSFCKCFGITKEPKTGNYALIMRYFPEGDLRHSLLNLDNRLTWKDKLQQLYSICDNLKSIHDQGYVHGDIHSGNILISDDWAHLTDFGLTQSAKVPDSVKTGSFGVVPYMAPELFRNTSNTQSTDIYAIGIIMSEYASEELAFCGREHDLYLQLDIIGGLRPDVPTETPECFVELMKQCLSDKKQERPTAEKLRGTIFDWYCVLRDNEDTTEAKQFKTADQLWKQRKPTQKHPGAIYSSRLISYISVNTVRDASIDITDLETTDL